MSKSETIILIVSILLVTLVSYTDDLDRQITQNRMGILTIHAKPGASVNIEQMRHEFWFGAALPNGIFRPGNTSPDAQKFKEVFLENFNSAVTENAVKWYSMERRKGQIDFSIVDSMLEWTDENDIPLRGHNLFWGVSKFVQRWIKELSDDELRESLQKRASMMGKRYKGRFSDYDFNNEMIHENYYEKRLGPDITKQMIDWFRQEDPDTPLYVNDYDVATGNRLDDYVEHIKDLLAQDIPIEGIGVQGHFHGVTFNADALQKSLDVLSQFTIPILITEFNMPGQKSQYYQKWGAKLTDEEEKQKAEELVKYYRICFAHPGVKGILMWGFWERSNWIPVSSLYRRDWTPTPAAHAYRDLVFNQWWTKYDGKTNDNGRCEVKAFFGKYRVKVNGEEKIVELKKKDGKKLVTFVE
jgi:endo-1,4-beta-xylanase